MLYLLARLQIPRLKHVCPLYRLPKSNISTFWFLSFRIGSFSKSVDTRHVYRHPPLTIPKKAYQYQIIGYCKVVRCGRYGLWAFFRVFSHHHIRLLAQWQSLTWVETIKMHSGRPFEAPTYDLKASRTVSRWIGCWVSMACGVTCISCCLQEGQPYDALGTLSGPNASVLVIRTAKIACVHPIFTEPWNIRVCSLLLSM